MAREAWSSRIGFILASMGSAVGIGNLWRFPYVVGNSGGGAFLVPYLLAIVLCALPLMILEFALGRHFRTSVVPALARIRPGFRWLGAFLVLVQSLILGYYLVITGWVLAYALAFASGRSIPFEGFTASYAPLAFFALAGTLCFLVVRAGVAAGLERVAVVLMPLLCLMLAVLAGVALALPGARQGLAFYLAPDFHRLGDPHVWTGAFGQAFFSLGVGTGIMLTYGSYAAHARIVPSAVAITVADLAVALLGGLVIFPLVFSFGFDPAAGVPLAFVTLPSIFERMDWGHPFGAAFFLLMFFAALTSAVSILELPVATAMDVWGVSRRRAAALVTALVILAGLPSALSYTRLGLAFLGMPILDLQDLAFGTVGLMLSALALSLSAGWFVSPRILREAVGPGRWRLRALLLVLRILVPLALLLNLGARLLGPR
jgi:NSS family neurotransmitter:Na+ symporter